MVDATLALEHTPDDPRRARSFVESHLTDVPSDVCGDALLLVSELVTNAVRHGRAPAHLDLTVEADVIRVSVHDSAPELPKERTPGLGDFSGRGLVIVATLASSWGVEVVGAPDDGEVGKRVWFELPRAG